MLSGRKLSTIMFRKLVENFESHCLQSPPPSTCSPGVRNIHDSNSHCSGIFLSQVLMALHENNKKVVRGTLLQPKF
jgi:hypothetical protein